MDENFVENPEESNDSEQEVSIVIRKATAEMDEMSGKEQSNNSGSLVSIVNRKATTWMDENSREWNLK